MKSDYSRQYDAFERNHWWFRVRRIVLKGLLDRHVGWQPGLRVVEAGTGVGKSLAYLGPLFLHPLRTGRGARVRAHPFSPQQQ